MIYLVNDTDLETTLAGALLMKTGKPFSVLAEDTPMAELQELGKQGHVIVARVCSKPDIHDIGGRTVGFCGCISRVAKDEHVTYAPLDRFTDHV